MKSTIILGLAAVATADDFARFNQAVPSSPDVLSIAPVFDMDSDSCYPAGGISITGQQNAGLGTSGNIVGSCRTSNFLDQSNSYHRFECRESGGSTYCGHFYGLYFEKDQLFSTFGGGHRHDWEAAAVWTTNGVVTHGSVSAHGDMDTQPIGNVGTENGHLKVVYHKDGVSTHAFRFSDTSEVAENSYGAFVTPVVISWFEASSSSLSNSDFRSLLNGFDYGSANFPIRDSAWIGELNEFKPDGYPTF